MLRRLFRLIATFFQAGVAEETRTSAQRQMRERRAAVRLRAAHAVSERYTAQILITSTQQHIQELRANAELATDAYESGRLAREIAEYEEYIRLKQRRLEAAERIVEDARASLRLDE